MAYTTINDPSEYFNTLLYTGNDDEQIIIGTGFQPDWIWIKDRGSSNDHILSDTSRGITKRLESNTTDAEGANSQDVKSVQSNGFTVGNNAGVNAKSSAHVAWQWKANGGTTTTNDASSTGVGNQDSVYQANTTAGFSIVTWTGSNANATLAHGLGAVPNWIIVKARGGTEKWGVYHHKNTSAPETDHLILNDTDATLDSTNVSNDTAPTSTVFTVADSGIANEVGKTYVGYLFAEKQGYSKFGSYTGNGNADGTFVYTGFKPAWLLIKNTADTADWTMWDATRYPTNPQNIQLYPNLSNAEDSPSTSTIIDLLSNGFKLRGTNNKINGSSDKIIYMAFAESPFVTSNETPNNAR